MEVKYLKDLIIALVVILVISFGVKDYYLYKSIIKVPAESKYKKIALSDNLLREIQNIEYSIQDRKNFVFTVTKDPLEQNLIVKTKKDLEKQWREEIESMVRLESTMLSELGDKIASISYLGETNQYQVGDSFAYGKITDIREGEITYSYEGKERTLGLQKLPPKPVEIMNKKSRKDREYNW